MIRRLAAALAVGFFALSPSIVTASQAPQAPTVTAVEVVSQHRLTGPPPEQELTGLTGQPFSRARVRESLDKLWGLGLFDKVEVDYGGADSCFDVIRAVSFISRYQDLYTNNRKMLGPNIVANYEIGAKMTLADFAWAHGEQTRIFRAFQRIYKDYDLVIGPTVGFTPFPWKQLYID